MKLTITAKPFRYELDFSEKTIQNTALIICGTILTKTVLGFVSDTKNSTQSGKKRRK